MIMSPVIRALEWALQQTRCYSRDKTKTKVGGIELRWSGVREREAPDVPNVPVALLGEGDISPNENIRVRTTLR